MRQRAQEGNNEGIKLRQNRKDMRGKEQQGRIHGYQSGVWMGRGGEKKQSVTDRPTDQRTNRWTERVVETRARD